VVQGLLTLQWPLVILHAVVLLHAAVLTHAIVLLHALLLHCMVWAEWGCHHSVFCRTLHSGARCSSTLHRRRRRCARCAAVLLYSIAALS
jgi:hypothetical protein